MTVFVAVVVVWKQLENMEQLLLILLI